MKRIGYALLSLMLGVLLSGGRYFVSCSSGGGDSDFRDSQLNHPPVAQDISLVTVVDRPISSTLQAIDPDGDDLSYRIVSGPGLGILQFFNPDSGTFTYVSNTAGVDNFTYLANDGRIDSNTATVTITINRTLLLWKRFTASELEITQSLQQLLTTQSVMTTEVSTEQVKTWTGTLTPQPDRVPLLAIDPFNPELGLAYVQDGGLYRSVDGGVSWVSVQTQAWFVEDSVAVSTLAFSAFVPGLVYGVVDTVSKGHRLARSSDGGTTWQLLSDSPQGRLLELVSGPLERDGSVLLYARIDRAETIYRAVDYPY